MRKIPGMLFLALASSLFAQQRPTAYQAMRVVGTQLNRDFVRQIIAVSGTDGNPQPDVWRILLNDPAARGGVREVEVTNGRITSERTPLRQSVVSSLGAVIDTHKLNLDSSGAFTVAGQAAASSHLSFGRVDYTLRVDDRGNPIWIVALHGANGNAGGTVYLGANHGTITRTEGLFGGGDVVAANGRSAPDSRAEANDDATRNLEEADDPDDDGDTNPVKLQIKRAFRQARDSVKQTFYKVRRSFVDFFQDK